MDIGDAFVRGAVGDAHGFDGEGAVGAAGIVGEPDGDLAGHAVELGLYVDVADGGGGAFDGGERLKPARGAAVHGGIGQLRGDDHVAGASDGAGQIVVVFGDGGVGEEDVEGDGLGLGGGEGVDGAGDHLAGPGEAPEAGDAGLVDGDDGDIVGNRKGAAETHHLIAAVAIDAGGAEVDHDPGGSRDEHDRKTPRDLGCSRSAGRHQVNFQLTLAAGRAFSSVAPRARWIPRFRRVQVLCNQSHL